MLSDNAKQFRNEQRRKWYANNRDKAKQYQDTYWERRYQREQAERAKVEAAALAADPATVAKYAGAKNGK